MMDHARSLMEAGGFIESQPRLSSVIPTKRAHPIVPACQCAATASSRNATGTWHGRQRRELCTAARSYKLDSRLANVFRSSLPANVARSRGAWQCNSPMNRFLGLTLCALATTWLAADPSPNVLFIALDVRLDEPLWKGCPNTKAAISWNA